MAKKLFVGNLSHSINDDQLKEVFEPFGSVQSARVIMDRETRRSKGFGFVEMGSETEAQAAIDGLNTTEVSGRPITVKEARPREEREPREFSRPRGDRDNRGGGERPGGGFGARKPRY